MKVDEISANTFHNLLPEISSTFTNDCVLELVQKCVVVVRLWFLEKKTEKPCKKRIQFQNLQEKITLIQNISLNSCHTPRLSWGENVSLFICLHPRLSGWINFSLKGIFYLKFVTFTLPCYYILLTLILLNLSLYNTTKSGLFPETIRNHTLQKRCKTCKKIYLGPGKVPAPRKNKK